MTHDATLENSHAKAADSPLKALVQRAHKLLSVVWVWTVFLAPLVTRVIVGYAFYFAGKGKLENPQVPLDLFIKNNIPFPQLNAVFVSNLECYGGILLMLGLFTRPIAALLGTTMFVALMTVHRPEFADVFKGESSPLDMLPMPFAIPMLWLLFYGPGTASVDAIIRTLLEKTGWIAPSATCAK